MKDIFDLAGRVAALLKNLLFNNLHWKILSVILSVFLWFIVINITNPVVSISTTLKLNLKETGYLDGEQKIIVNESALKDVSVTIDVRCKQSDAAGVRDKLDAYLDFSLFEMITSRQTGQPQNTEISVTKRNESDDFQIIGWSPRKVSVVIDNKLTAERAVAVNFNASLPAEGHTQTGYAVTPPTVSVTGPETQIQKIASISVAADLTDKKESFVAEGRVYAYDADGKDLLLDISPNIVSVKVPISMLANIPLKEPSIKGKPAQGYIVTGITMSMGELHVLGEAADIAATDSIKLSDIFIDGAMASRTVGYDLRKELVDTKLNVVNGEDYECTVIVNIEKLAEKTFVIPIADVNKTGYTKGANILTESVTARIAGTRAALDALAKLNVTVNLSLLQEGLNEVPVYIYAVEGVEILEQTEFITVRVGDEPSGEPNGEPSGEPGGEPPEGQTETPGEEPGR